jgi:hypothetical protein
VGAGQDADPDNVGVLLQGGLRHLVRGYPHSHIDHFDAGISHRSRNDLYAAIVAVQSQLGEKDLWG